MLYWLRVDERLIAKLDEMKEVRDVPCQLTGVFRIFSLIAQPFHDRSQQTTAKSKISFLYSNVTLRLVRILSKMLIYSFVLSISTLVSIRLITSGLFDFTKASKGTKMIGMSQT